MLYNKGKEKPSKEKPSGHWQDVRRLASICNHLFDFLVRHLEVAQLFALAGPVLLSVGRARGKRAHRSAFVVG